jgi:glycosyltransferase involved in cell wall biosynthesis
MSASSTLVSTLLPTNVLNPWVDASVASALAQDHPNHEVLVIHDGIDPDPSRSWVSDPRVRCLRTDTSLGLANALAFGAAHAHGSYLARLDGDDLAHPERISTQLAFMEANPGVVVAGTTAHRIDESGARTGLLGTSSTGDLRRQLLDRNMVIHSSAMIDRKSYDLAGGYDPRLRQMEDYHLWLRMALLGEVHVLQRRLTEYRVHSAQMNRGASPTGDYVSHVLAARVRLARALGRSTVLQRGRNEVWRAAQLARYRGWRAPGYTR